MLLCTTRDSVLDTQNILKDNEKPEKGPSLKKNFVSIRASAICYKHEKNAKPKVVADKIIIFIGGLMIILGIAIALIAAL